MSKTTSNKELSKLVAELEEEEALDKARQLIDEGEDPLFVLEEAKKGLIEVGKLYEEQVYFISALIMGGEIMSGVSNIVLPLITSTITSKDSGLILLGTVETDIHFLGKDLFKVMARCHGFSVNDIGVDVPADDFMKAYKEINPDIIGMSCLLDAGYDKLKETIGLIREDIPSPESIPSFVIGGVVNQMVCEYAGADFWTNDAMEGVRICQGVMNNKKD